MMDDSVELHAPRHAFPTKRPKSEESSKTKRSKTVASSSQPKSVASSVSAAERPSSHGSGHRRSRTPERKRRHGESPRHQSSRRDGHSSDRRESERDRPSSSGGSSSRRRAESGSVSKTSDTRPSSSSSRHHRERRRESSDRTGGTFVVRREFQLSPPKSKTHEKHTITVVASPARQIHIESAPAVPVPAPVADGSAGARTAQQVRARQRAAARPRVTGRQCATARSQATTRPQITDRPQATARQQGTDQPQGTARQQGTARPQVTALSQWTTVVELDNTADVSMVESSHSSQLRFDDPDDFDGPAPLPAAGVDGSSRQENPAATPVGGPDVSIQTGTSTPLLFPSIPKTINEATLVDFMSMWTLLQRRMELPSVPDNSISPTVQTSLPVPERDLDNMRSATPAGSPTRTKSPERFLHTPQSSVLLSGGPRRPTARPGLPWDLLERPWEELGTTASQGIPDHVPHSPDPCQWSPQHGMSLPSTLMQHWTWTPREHFRRTRVLRATGRRFRLRNMIPSGKRSLLPGERSRSTLPRLRELQGSLCWTWVRQRFLTECPGWTSRLSRTPWRPRHG